jgi:hypothetical protein
MSVAYLSGNVLAATFHSVYEGEGYFNSWWILNTLTGIITIMALVYFRQAKHPTRVNMSEKPSGVELVLRSPEFMSLAAVQFYLGVLFTGSTVVMMMIVALPAKGDSGDDDTSTDTGGPYGYGESSAVLATIMGFSAIWHLFESFYILPSLLRMAKGSPVPAMDIGIAISVVSDIILCCPVYGHGVGPVAVFLIFKSSALPLCMTGANLVGPIYAERYGKNLRGTILGISRTWFNVGQMVGPIFAVYLWTEGDLQYFGASASMLLLAYIPWRFYHLKSAISSTHANSYDSNSNKAVVVEEDGMGMGVGEEERHKAKESHYN